MLFYQDYPLSQINLQWNLDIKNLSIMKSALQRMISFTLIVKYLKKNLHIMTLNSKQISPVTWPYVLVLLCVIFLTYMCCPRLCSHGGWLPLNCSAVGIGFNGAETNCGIARILGILLMNSWD